MHKGNLVILVTCQLISATGSFVMVMLGGIIGSSLSANPALATLPLTMVVVGTAATTIPATILMRRTGRKKGFALGSLSAALAAALAAAALYMSSFVLFVGAATIFGINLAFTHQYRYAAAESVSAKHVPRAISFVLLGAIGGAFLGKALATQGYGIIEAVPYGGTIVVVAALYVVQAILFLRLRGIAAPGAEHQIETTRKLGEIVLQPVYVVAVLGGTVGYGLMTLVMTATPLSMHINDGYSLEQTANVIRAHVLGMYVPSLASGFLIERFGVTRLMFVGALLLLVTSVVGLQGQSIMHYSWALVLLGIGWNFLYVGGTTMLTYTYSLEERFRAQAVNEFLIFGTAATASLLAGTMMHYFGWYRLMLIPIPILVMICIALLVVRRNPLLRAARESG